MVSPHTLPENWHGRIDGAGQAGPDWRGRSGRSEVADGGCQNFGRFFRMPLTPLRITSTTFSTTFPFSFTE